MDMSTLFALVPPQREWVHVVDLLLAFVLSSLIGFERDKKLKSAGLRTHALVGLGAALLMLVSKHGFADVLVDTHLRLDPSRIAAQIVSGIGFIGGGLIFVRKDIVHGLTTAATIWLTAAVGMACGAGLYLFAFATCGGYFIVVSAYTAIINNLHGSTFHLLIRYRVGHDVAATILALCNAKNLTIIGFLIDQTDPDPETASLELRVRGKTTTATLIQDLSALPSILSVDLNPHED